MTERPMRSPESWVRTRNPKPETQNWRRVTRSPSLRRGRTILLLTCLVAWVPSACGKKGSLRAPELITPETIANLTARPGPNHIVLTWSRPMRDAEGKEIKDLASFVIFRKDLSQTCPDCPVPYKQLTTVVVEDREKFAKQNRYRFIDEEVQPRVVYRYRVSSQLTDGSLSEPSNEVEITQGP